MKTLRRRCFSLLLFTACALHASAGALDAGRIPADAAWVGHLDVERMKTSEIGAFLLEQSQDPEAARQLAAAQLVFDFDPRKDLKTLTAFGADGKEENVVLRVEGVFDGARLVTVAGGEPEYAKTAHGEDEIHQWRDRERGVVMFAAIPVEGRLVIGRGLASVQAALDTERGSKPALKGRPDSFLPPPSKNLPMLTAAFSLARLPLGETMPVFLKDARTGHLFISELAGEVSLEVVMDLGVAERAQQIRDLVAGFSVMAQMNAAENPDLADLAQRSQVTTEGSTARLRIRMPAAQLRDAVKARRAGAAPAVLPADF